MDEEVDGIRHIEMQSGRPCVRLIESRRESVVHLWT